MIQFKKAGAALAMFVVLNAVLYRHAWNDPRVIPAKGNVAHQRIIAHAKKGAANVQATISAAQSGSALATKAIEIQTREEIEMHGGNL